MKDKLTKRKKPKIDYKNLIKENGLWSVYKRFCKHLMHIKSTNRRMYLFCLSYCPLQLKAIKEFESDYDYLSTNFPNLIKPGYGYEDDD